jgi:hypothetical protein
MLAVRDGMSIGAYQVRHLILLYIKQGSKWNDKDSVILSSYIL